VTPREEVRQQVNVNLVTISYGNRRRIASLTLVASALRELASQIDNAVNGGWDYDPVADAEAMLGQ
jgi:hypothetical protein